MTKLSTQKRCTYIPPLIEMWHTPSAGESLLSHSLSERSDYGSSSTSGWGQGDMTGRDDYSSGTGGWAQGDMTGRDGYVSGSNSWTQGDFGGRSGYGNGGSGWE